MSQWIRVCVLGGALAAIGCGSSVEQLGPVKDEPKADPDAMRKNMEESMRRNNESGRGNLQVPAGDQNKTP